MIGGSCLAAPAVVQAVQLPMHRVHVEGGEKLRGVRHGFFGPRHHADGVWLERFPQGLHVHRGHLQDFLLLQRLSVDGRARADLFLASHHWAGVGRRGRIPDPLAGRIADPARGEICLEAVGALVQLDVVQSSSGLRQLASRRELYVVAVGGQALVKAVLADEEIGEHGAFALDVDPRRVVPGGSPRC